MTSLETFSAGGFAGDYVDRYVYRLIPPFHPRLTQTRSRMMAKAIQSPPLSPGMFSLDVSKV